MTGAQRGDHPIQTRRMYLPFIYTDLAKHPGRQFFVRQVLLDDLAMLVLSVSIFNPLTPSYLIGMLFCFLGLFTTYELGYRENDAVAETKREEHPTLPAVYQAYRDYPVSPGAWIWGLAFSLVGVGLLHSDDRYSGGQFGRVLPLPGWIETAVWWLLVLVAVRVTFWLFNHTRQFNRIFVFPFLHLLKTGGFIVLLPTTMIGLFLIVSQVLRTWINYMVYRCGGDKDAFPNHVTRWFIFLLLVAAAAIGMDNPTPLVTVEFWVITAWCTARAALHVAGFGSVRARVGSGQR